MRYVVPQHDMMTNQHVKCDLADAICCTLWTIVQPEARQARGHIHDNFPFAILE